MPNCYKIISVTLALIGCTYFSATAQQAQSNWDYYIKAGWTYSGILGTDSNTEYKSGYAVGVGLKIPFKNYWWLQSELALEKYQVQYLGVNPTQFSFQYVGMPLMLVYRRSDILELHIGVQPSLLIKSSSFKLNKPDEIVVYGKDDFGTATIWPVAGLEVNISPLAVGFRYSYQPLGIAKSETAKETFGNANLHALQVYGAIVF